MISEGWVSTSSHSTPGGPPQRPVPMPPRSTNIPGIYSSKFDYDTSHFYNNLLNLDKPDPKTPSLEIPVPHIIALYDIADDLGSGSTAVVRLARNKQTGNEVAIKCITPATNVLFFISKNWRNVRKYLDEFAGEFVVKVLDVFEEEHFMFIIMERYAGSIVNVLKKLQKPWTEADACRIMKQILHVVMNVHQRGLIHCDLTLSNILSADKELSSIKVSGFTKVAIKDNEDDVFCDTHFKAPEIIAKQLHGKPADMWAVGCISYFLLSGNLPYHDSNKSKLSNSILNDDVPFPAHWEQIDSKARSFVTSLLQKDPTARPDVNTALTHPWLTEGGLNNPIPNFSETIKLQN